jgi:hypothetical protein
MTESAKKTNWGPEESRIWSSLEAETPIEDVKIDELDSGDDTRKEKKTSSRSRSRTCVVSASVLIIIVLIVLITPLAILLPENRSPASLPINVTQFAEKHIPPYSRAAADRDSSTPQAKALKFISSTSSAADPIHRVQQRYALVVLYYSTAPSGDGSAIKDADECDWFRYEDRDSVLQSTWDGSRSICDGSNRYLLLALDGDTVDGTIPRELDMLSTLQYINFRGSAVHGTVPTEL